MKRFVIWLSACIALLLAGCGAQADGLALTFDENGNYTGFEDLPKGVNAADFEKAGWVVRQGVETTANAEVWERFVEAAGQGEDASVRIVSLYTEDPDTAYYIDLFYSGGSYYLFDNTAEEQTKEPYQYLLTLEEQFGNPKKNTAVVVLTNDSKLTFDDVIGSMISSDMDYIRSVPPYRLVMFL